MTIKAVLVTSQKNSSDKSPVKIRVTIKGKPYYKSTGIRISEDDWNKDHIKKTVTNSQAMNMIIKNKIRDIESEIYSLRAQGKTIHIRKILHADQVSEEIYAFGKRVLKEKGTKKYSKDTTARQEFDLTRLNKFAPGITFDEVDQSFLRRYEDHLRGLELSNNTIHRVWKHFKSLFNAAKREGVTSNYPFEGYANPRYRQPIRTFLQPHEIEKLEAVLKKPITESQNLVLHYFLLGIYGGFRYSDWVRFNYAEFINEDRILLRSQKNGEIISMKMHDKLKTLVEKLKDMPSVFSEPKMNYHLKAIAKIAGIKKHLTCHVSRHSYCTYCIYLKIPDNIIARTMGISIRMLTVYKHMLDSSVDEEMEKWNQ